MSSFINFIAIKAAESVLIAALKMLSSTFSSFSISGEYSVEETIFKKVDKACLTVLSILCGAIALRQC
jgi:hypothetical protein